MLLGFRSPLLAQNCIYISKNKSSTKIEALPPPTVSIKAPILLQDDWMLADPQSSEVVAFPDLSTSDHPKSPNLLTQQHCKCHPVPFFTS